MSFELKKQKMQEEYETIFLECKCGEKDYLNFKTIYGILHNIALQEERYRDKNGKGWKYLADFVFDCCIPNITYKELQDKYKIPDRENKQLDSWY